MADLCSPNPKSNRAKRAVRRGMAIAANYGHAGLCRAKFWTHDVDDTAIFRLPAMRLNAVLLRIGEE